MRDRNPRRGSLLKGAEGHEGRIRAEADRQTKAADKQRRREFRGGGLMVQQLKLVRGDRHASFQSECGESKATGVA